MDYIILDLEWNNVYFKKENRFINEILQIGAVRLDNELNVIDTFQINVRSALTTKLSGKVIRLTGITNEEMLCGIPLDKAVEAYNNWVPDDTVTMTWSNSDLYAIVENTNIFKLKETFKISRYLDLQTYVQGELKLSGIQINNQISLINAAVMLDIPTEEFELHTAKDDSYVASLILKKTFNSERFKKYIKDTNNGDFYKRLTFKSYYIKDVRDKRIDQAYLRFHCPICNNLAERKGKWKYFSNWHRATYFCTACDSKLKAMISFKQTYDKLIVKKRILPVKQSEGAHENATV